MSFTMPLPEVYYDVNSRNTYLIKECVMGYGPSISTTTTPYFCTTTTNQTSYTTGTTYSFTYTTGTATTMTTGGTIIVTFEGDSIIEDKPRRLKAFKGHVCGTLKLEKK